MNDRSPMSDPRPASPAQAPADSLLDAVLDASTAGIASSIAVRDTPGNIVDFECRTLNKAGERILCRPRDRVIGHRLLEVMPGMKEAGLFDALARVTNTGEPFRTEQHYTGDGLDIWADITAVKLGDGYTITFADITRQKAAEQAALDLAERNRVLIETVRDPIFSIDTKATFTSLNAAFEAVTGWPREAWIGRSFANLIHPIDLPAVARDYAIALAGQAPPRYQARVRCADGRYREVELHSAPRVEQGRVTGVLGIARDVTAHAAESAARARLAAIVESSDDAIVGEDLDGTVVSWNAAAERLFGYSADEIVGRPVTHLWPPELAGEFQAILDELRRGNRVANVETQRVRKDGTRVDVSITVSPIRDPAGQITGFSKIARDVSHRRRAEEALRRSEERYRLINRATNDVIYDWDLVADAIFWNDALESTLRHPRDRVPPGVAFWSDHVHPDDRTRVTDDLHAAIGARRDIWAAEYRFRRGDGAYATVLDRGCVVYDPDGRPRRMIGAMQDVTDHRAAQDKLRQSEELLRRMFDSSVDCIKTLDLDGRLLTINPCGLKLMELPDFADVRGAPWPSFWPADQRSVVERALNAARAGGVGNFEGFCPTASGNPKWWHVVVSPICAADGAPERVLAVSRDVTDRHAAEDRLRHASLHDALTGLPNRAHFLDRVDACLARAARDPAYRFAVLFLDLDRFKVINDSLGHAAGDRLLVAVADRLRDAVRAALHPCDGATIARLGGDEFTVLLDVVASPYHAATVAQQVLPALAAPLHIDGQELSFTASLGVVVPAGRDYASARDVLRDADAAMYRAKSSGKNRHAVFDATMHAQALDRLRLENDLRRAADRDELVLHFQPILSLATREVHGFEALVRWCRNGRLVSPADFIPVAEDTGLIVPIGRWVLEQAVRQSALWRDTFPHLPRLRLSVNLSLRQLQDADLVRYVRHLLAAHRLDPARLMLEITESVIMDDAPSARAVLDELRDLGIPLAMDDFGTGYSSLSCLHKFPVEVLKVDRAFVANLDHRRDAALLHSVCTLAHNLGMTLVAEGIETVDQLAFLQSAECDFGQGYLFAKPMPAADVTHFLRRPPTEIPLAG